MFTILRVWHPIPGKEAEMRAVGIDVVKSRQARGEHLVLYSRMASPVGSQFVVTHQHRDFAAWEAWLAANEPDPDFQTVQARANALSRTPVATLLAEDIVPLNPASGSKFVEAALIYPALGNQGAVESLLKERVANEQAKRSVGLVRYPYSSEGVVFGVAGFFPSLAALEENRRERRSDTAFQKAAAELTKLIRCPAVWSLFSIVASGNS